MNLHDIKTQITDYIENSSQDPTEWDIDDIADMIHENYDDITSIDDIPEDEFTDLMERGQYGEYCDGKPVHWITFDGGQTAHCEHCGVKDGQPNNHTQTLLEQ